MVKPSARLFAMVRGAVPEQRSEPARTRYAPPKERFFQAKKLKRVIAMILLAAIAVGIGLYAAWCSGQDVGYRNALREQIAHENDELEPTVYLTVANKKGDAENEH